MTWHWVLGALILGFLPSWFKGLLTRSWQTSSSLERLKRFLILLTLLGSCWRGIVVSFSRNILLAFLIFFYNSQVDNIQTGIHNAFFNRLAPPHFSFIYNENVPYSAGGALCCESICFASWENLVCHSHHWFGPQNPILHPKPQQRLVWPCVPHSMYEVYVHRPLLWLSDSW